jgi:hypothetical protein
MPTGSRSVVSEVLLWHTDPNLKASSTDKNSMFKNQQQRSQGSAVAQKGTRVGVVGALYLKRALDAIQ